MPITAHQVNFNSVYLTSIEGVSVLSVNANPPGVLVNQYPIPRGDSVRVPTRHLEGRIIEVRLYISCNTRELCERSISELNRVLQGVEKTLIIPQGSSTRKYTATAGAWTMEELRGSTAILSIPFICSNQYGTDVATTDLVNTSGITAATRDDQISFPTGQGLAELQVPVIQVTISTLTQGSGNGFTIMNVATGQSITVEQTTWAIADVLKVDVQVGAAYINSVEVDYTGVLPRFGLGTTTLRVTNDFTARNYALHAYYYKRYG